MKSFLFHQNDTDGDLDTAIENQVRSAIAIGRDEVSAEVIQLARRSIEEGLSLQLRTPGRSRAIPYGDLVPLGFLGAALERISESDAEAASDAGALLQELRRHLEDHRRDWGWGDSRTSMPTSTDTALVALAGVTPDHEGMQALRGPSGGFMTRARDEEIDSEGRRRSSTATLLQSEDVPTTALIESFRIDAGLEPGVDGNWFLKRMPEWSGLHFTPPLFGLWSVARFLGRLERHARSTTEQGNESQNTRVSLQRLRNTLLHLTHAQRGPEGGFGRFDPVLNDSLGVLTLGELHEANRQALAGQLRLLENWRHPRAIETPFHSILNQPRVRTYEELLEIQTDRTRSYLHGRVYAVRTIEDPNRLIVTALACLALHIDTTTVAQPPYLHSIEFESAATPEEQAFLDVRPYAAPSVPSTGDPSDPFTIPQERVRLDDAMRHTLDRLGSILVSERARERVLAAVARTDPNHVKGANFGLEFRLHPGDDAIDFFWCMCRASRNLTALLSEPDRDSRFRHLARLWKIPTEGGSPPIAHIDSIWLEHDLDEKSTTNPPSFFFGPSTLQSNNETSYGTKGAARNVRRILDAFELKPSALANLEATLPRLEELVVETPVFQTGLMFGRSGQPIRLCFQPQADKHAVKKLIQDLGLGHRIVNIEHHLELIGDGMIAVCVDVSPNGVDSKIGFECRMAGRVTLQKYAIDFFNRLAEQGMVDQDRASRFCASEGWSELGSHGGITRTISHLKIVDQPDRPVEVKGYLGMYRTKTPLTLINVNTPG